MTGWLSSEQIQRRVRRRRIRRRRAAGLAVLVIAGTAVGLGVSGTGSRTPPIAAPAGTRVGDRLPGAIQLVGDASPLGSVPNSDVAAVAAAERALAISLLKHANLLADGNGNPNVAASPLSLYLALAMLRNGARGETATEIATAMQAANVGLATQNAGLEQLVADLTSAATHDGFDLQSANSLWQESGFPIEPTFLNTLATYFHSGVWQVDFAHHTADAVKAIDRWTSDTTHGKITKLFESLDPATVLVLANALYFHANWQTPFYPGGTVHEPFHTARGAPVLADFMDGPARVATAADYQAVALPYVGGRFEALAVMPTTSTLPSFVAGLSAGALQDIAQSADSAPRSEVRLPRFAYSTAMDLKPVLSALGMGQIVAGGGDFTAITSVPIQLDQAVQRVYLSVGERGTTAAAVTGYAFEALSAHRPPPTFDHPFLFLIRDTVTGAVLFSSEINDPTAG